MMPFGSRLLGLLLIATAVHGEESVLPEDRVFPQGRIFPFMGYSGAPRRDALHGFSVAGPSYSPDQGAVLAAAEAAGLSYPYSVGIPMNFLARNNKSPLELGPEEIAKRITEQVLAVADHDSICWWYLKPEELRYWRKKEMDYLQAATQAIRSADPQGRPIWMYEPNHRNSESLVHTGRFQDILGKGFYVNLAGYRDRRIWVRWSMEQQVEAIANLAREEGVEGRKRIAIVLPELARDPDDPALDHRIPDWVRHDVYLGLMCGGKGVAIWSLFPRPEVRRTWDIWYDAYSRVARELTGPLGLGQVFLFGRPAETFSHRITSGPREVALVKGGDRGIETQTSSEAEKQEALIQYPSVCVSQFEHAGATWLFLCNSSGTQQVGVLFPGFNDTWKLEDVFAERGYTRRDGRLQVYLPPLAVRCYRIWKP